MTEKIWRLGVLLVVKKADMFLLVQKPSGEWQLPAGGREGNESILMTASRELMEETSIDISKALSVDISFELHEFEWNDEWKSKSGFFGQRRQIVIVKVPENTEVLVDGVELKDYKWLSLEESLKLLSHDDMRVLLKKVVEE